MITPTTDDRETAPYFSGAAEQRLCIKTCVACGRGIHPPMPQCPRCGSSRTGWRDASGLGTLHTWTVVTHQVHPDFPAPYTLVVVQLDDYSDIRIVGRIEGQRDLKLGQAMQVVFDELSTGLVLPNWTPVESL